MYLAACAIGFLAGVAELMARYRDAPWKALASLASIAYVTINALMSGIALYLILLFAPPS